MTPDTCSKHTTHLPCSFMHLPLCALSVPILARNNAICWPALPEHLPQVPSERVRLFKRGEVASFLMRTLEDDLAHRVDPPENRVRKDESLKEKKKPTKQAA